MKFSSKYTKFGAEHPSILGKIEILSTHISSVGNFQLSVWTLQLSAPQPFKPTTPLWWYIRYKSKHQLPYNCWLLFNQPSYYSAVTPRWTGASSKLMLNCCPQHHFV